jgi:hypothetical protein
MGYKKPTYVTQKQLINYPLPSHGGKYKVVSHKFVLEQTINKLRECNFSITNQTYRASKQGNVAQGILHITPKVSDHAIDSEDSLGMMFGWSNSYDKSTRFQCAIGAYVTVCSNGMVGGELSFSRKHIGKADYDIINQINKQISKANATYKNLIRDKNDLVKHILTPREQSELAGRLFFDEELISPNQLNIIKQEMKKPSYDYKVDKDNAWSFYNHVTHALKQTHPKNWMSDQKKFHEFMTAEFKCNSYISKNDTQLNSYDRIIESIPDIDNLIEEF